jgi:hypothetical protein
MMHRFSRCTKVKMTFTSESITHEDGFEWLSPSGNLVGVPA